MGAKPIDIVAASMPLSSAFNLHGRDDAEAHVDACHDGPACDVQDCGDALASAAMVHVAHPLVTYTPGVGMHGEIYASKA